MKNSNQCSKCQSNDIVKISNPGSRKDGSWVRISWFGGSNIVWFTRFVCCNCGFSEEWVETSEDLEKLKKKFDT